VKETRAKKESQRETSQPNPVGTTGANFREKRKAEHKKREQKIWVPWERTRKNSSETLEGGKTA